MLLDITRATKEDIPQLRDILTDATTYKVSHGDMSWGEGKFTDQEVAYALTKSNYYCVRLNGEIIATFALDGSDERIWGKRPAEALYLHRLAVRADQRGKAIGQQLVSWAARQAKHQKKQFLRLDCPPHNTKLRVYYEKQGFVKVGEKHITKPETYTAALYQRPV